MIGTHIGPFVLLRLLGAGGMGRVYLAEHSLMKDLHAIKILEPHLTQSPQLVARFVNEARAAAKVRHRNLVRVHNIDRMPDGGPWFMVLDYLEGTTLARFMASPGGAIPPHLILHVLGQVANCMQHVHDSKIVHRDLKPENIFLIRQGDDPHFPVVLDLGVAQLGEELSAGPATQAGTVVGTPIYMAPEQLRGDRVTQAADLFALGVIAYEMSTGGWFPYQYDEDRSAYLGLPSTEIYYRQRSAPPVDPRRRNPALGDAWVNALRATLHADPTARPTSARALALLLAGAVAPGGSHPGGLEIIRRVAHELNQSGASGSAAPSEIQAEPRPATDPGRGESRESAVAQNVTLQAPSTLAGAASEASLRTPHPRTRRWGVVVGAASAVLIAVVVAVLVVDRLRPSARRSADEAPAPAVVSMPVVTEGVDTGPPPPAQEVLQDEPQDEPARGSAVGGEPPAPTREGTSKTSEPAAPRDSADSAARPTAGAVDAGAASRPTTTTTAAGDAGVVGRPPIATTAPAVTPKKPGELAIIVRPWAMIWLNGKSLGQTPFRKTVAAGRYRVRITNEDLGKDETTSITVTPDQTTTLERKW